MEDGRPYCACDYNLRRMGRLWRGRRSHRLLDHTRGTVCPVQEGDAEVMKQGCSGEVGVPVKER